MVDANRLRFQDGVRRKQSNVCDKSRFHRMCRNRFMLAFHIDDESVITRLWPFHLEEIMSGRRKESMEGENN